MMSRKALLGSLLFPITYSNIKIVADESKMLKVVDRMGDMPNLQSDLVDVI